MIPVCESCEQPITELHRAVVGKEGVYHSWCCFNLRTRELEDAVIQRQSEAA